MNEQTIFIAALERDDAERQAFLDKACANQPILRRRVEKLLSSNEESPDFMHQPAGAVAPTCAAPATEAVGSQIGPYKLREKIGEGGMGVVYVAEQTKPVRRKVALKIIKPGMDSRQVIARFEAERQALALMDHPNIARVLDAGTTETGRPYFVMELVRGVPITEFCDEAKLDTRRRLELFVQVCQAVQHAHQKGVIHRDLKPGNVLVTMHDDKAVPKVIDFGVAKATSQRLTEQTIYTQFSQMVGTPLYMSPEQAQMSGLDVDTRSDVYSLGVLLYELLTGRTPFDRATLHKAGYDEMRRIIREDEPPRPSAQVSTLKAQDLSTVSEKRNVDPRKLSHQLRGELDWIAMKALEKDRARRYESASALAADVHRFLNSEAVQACPPSVSYRMRKLAARHRAALITAVLVSAALLAGTAVSIWQAARATHASKLARDSKQEADSNLQLAMEVLDEVFREKSSSWSTESFSGPMDPAAQFSAARAISASDVQFLQKLARFYGKFAASSSDERTVRIESARAHQRLGRIHRLLGEVQASESAFREAVTLWQEVVGEFPEEPQYRSELAAAHESLSELLGEIGRMHEAEQAYRNGFRLRTQLVAEHPENRDYLLALATGQLQVAFWQSTSAEESKELIAKATATLGNLGSLDDATPEQRSRLGGAYMQLALHEAQRLGRDTKAIEACREASNIFRRLTEQFPGRYRGSLGRSLTRLGWLLSDSPQERLTVLREAHAIGEQLITESPRNPHSWSLFAGTSGALAHEYRLRDRHTEAQPLFEAAVKGYEICHQTSPKNEWTRHQLILALNSLAWSHTRLGEQAAAEQAARRATSLLHRFFVESPKEDARTLNGFAWELVRIDSGFPEIVSAAVDLAQMAVDRVPTKGNYWGTLGLARYRVGNYEDAIIALDRSDKLLKGKMFGYGGFFIAMANWQLGRKDEARKWYADSAQWTQKNRPKNDELRQARAEAEALMGIEERPIPEVEPANTPGIGTSKTPDSADGK